MMFRMRSDATPGSPPKDVLAAFGVSGTPIALKGEFATAIVVADALVWEGAGESELSSAIDLDQFGQLLARALLFRLVADAVADPDSIDACATPFAPAVDLAVRLIQDHQ